jgi:hypothetical protein
MSLDEARRILPDCPAGLPTGAWNASIAVDAIREKLPALPPARSRRSGNRAADEAGARIEV